MIDNEPVDFATIFRHELAAVADRRRMQRMESLRQLGAGGDYSRTARQWALDAADQEALLAHRAAAAVMHVPGLVGPFEHTPLNVAEIRRVFRTLSEQRDVSPPELKEVAGDVASLAGGCASHQHLKESAAAAATAPEDQTPADAAHRVQMYLYSALVIRGPEADSNTHGSWPKLQTAVAEARTCSEKALEQRKVVLALGQHIEMAAQAKVAAEAAAKVLAIAELFEENTFVHQYEVFASAAAATAAVVRAGHAIKREQPAAPPGSVAANLAAMRTGLVNNVQQAAARMVQAFGEIARGCAPVVREGPLAGRAHLALQKALKAAIGDLGNEERAATWNRAESLSLESYAQLTLDSLNQTVARLGGQAPADQPPTNGLALLREVHDRSQQCYREAFLLLNTSLAHPIDAHRFPAGELTAASAREIATAAVQQLGSEAVRVAEWAWAAEARAAQALHEGLAILARWDRHHPLTPEAGKRAITSPSPTGPDAEHLRTQAIDFGLVGLAFSGGGIRSATFGLGVLQGLGNLRLLRFFDYLSTVSGGGYIGSWLAAWVHREQSLVNVEKQLDPSRVQQATAQRVVKWKEDKKDNQRSNPHYPLRGGAIDDEPEPVQHLRAYSRYLAPRLFSADAWTLGAIYLRNLVVNLASLAPWLFVVLMVSRLVLWAFTLDRSFAGAAFRTGTAIVFVLCALYLLGWGYRQRARLREAARDPLVHPDGADRLSRWQGVLLIVAGVLLALTSLWLFSYSPPVDATPTQLEQHSVSDKTLLRHPCSKCLNPQSLVHNLPAVAKFSLGGGVVVLLFSLGGALVRSARRREFRIDLFTLLLFADFIMGLALGFFVFLAFDLVIWPMGWDAPAIVTLGFPALVVAVVLADYFEMLVVGSRLEELEREWRSRIGAYLFMIALGWLAFFATTLYLPYWIQRLQNPSYRAGVVSTAAAVWAFVSGLGAWAGHWLQGKSASGWSIPWLRLLAFLGPPVFLIGLLCFGAMLTLYIAPNHATDYLDIVRASSFGTLVVVSEWLGLGVIGVIAVCILVRVNVFSLHMMYANRLVRCYLGASRRKQNWNRRASGPVRNPQGGKWWLWGPGTRGGPTNADVRDIARCEPTFTDFDPGDDFRLRDLRAVAPRGPTATLAAAGPDGGYRGPYPLFNTSLNLVGSADLAIQDRRGASFVLTPDFCGSPGCGYARNRSDALTLGRAMTVSGAAVDPNMGVYYTPPLTALMTILNTRLGWWLQNPRVWREDWKGTGPGARPLLLGELLGLTNETSSYIHLSDGGHFENLGVYELVRRRCRYIVVADAGTDRHAASDNLANLIRLVRTDFGIGIQMDTEQLTEGANGHTRWHCAIGLIHYEDVDPRAVAGILVYLCASLTGDEPPDIQQYAEANPGFPHDTTLNQFFSEAQFESYRGLGYHIATEVFAAAAQTMNRDCCDPATAHREVRDFFAALRSRWFPPPPGAEQQFLPAANLARGIERELRRPSLQHLRQELYPEVADGAPPAGPPAPLPPGSPTASAELHAVSELLHVMEMAWFGMKLDVYHAHTLNRGWMNLFRRWTSSPTFHQHWPYLRAEFSQDFVSFCEQALNMTPTDVVAQRMQGQALRNRMAEIREMDLEFEQEWASERQRLSWLTTGRYVLDALAIANQFHHPPLIWRLAMRTDLGTVMERSAGVACVGPPYLGAGRDLELFFWLRGPYRNLGIGRLCLPQIRDSILQALSALPRPDGKPYRLVTYYPNSGVDKADRLARAQWMNFFFDHRFRSIPADDPAFVAGVITLVLEL